MYFRKIVFLSLGLFLFTSNCVFAQLTKGQNSLGLNGRFKQDVQEPVMRANPNGDSVQTQTQSMSHQIGISYHRFISPKTSVGLQATWSNSYSSRFSRDAGVWYESINREKGISIRPSFRHHIPLNLTWYFFIDDYVNFTYRETNFKYQRNGEQEDRFSNTSDVALGIDPGVLFMFRKKWGLEASLPALLIRSRLIEEDDKHFNVETSLFENFNLGNVRFGLRYYFN